VKHWNNVVVTEYYLAHIEVEGVPIKGVLDKVEFQGSEVNVVDYKTGSVKYGKERLRPPNEKETLGGDYWRQLVFYKLLLENNRGKDWKMISGEIDFIEKDPKTDDFEKVRITVEDADMKIVTEQIVDVYHKIKNLEFSVGCGKDDCPWCNFVKEHLPHFHEETAAMQE